MREYAISLVGELAKSCPRVLEQDIVGAIGHLSANMFVVSLGIDPSRAQQAITNNAVWALGEMALQFNFGQQPFYAELFDKVVDIVNQPKLHKQIARNVTVSLFRIASINPEYASRSLHTYFKKACLILASIKAKDQAQLVNQSFTVLMQLIALNAQAVLSDFKYFLYAFVLFEDVRHPT